jgi:hypothetical protein
LIPAKSILTMLVSPTPFPLFVFLFSFEHTGYYFPTFFTSPSFKTHSLKFFIICTSTKEFHRSRHNKWKTWYTVSNASFASLWSLARGLSSLLLNPSKWIIVSYTRNISLRFHGY